jgi:asparagine synthase (glutamine-hydrolysing)
MLEKFSQTRRTTVCGIAGLYRTDHSPNARLDALKGMLAHVHHRGPDEMGYYVDDVVAMGTARLSIVDLAAGKQPVGDATGRYWIAFNGEIYNYRELRSELAELGFHCATNSDTEVLLNAWLAWGPQALARLNGAFAFCVADRVEGTIVLGRDRFGKRPLYYVERGGSLAFCSEMKSLLAYEPFRFEFDWAQLASIARVWTPLEHQSGFRSVQQLPAGAYLLASRDAIEIHHYAALELDQPSATLSEGEAAEMIRETLTQAVRLRLRSDVEVATYVSGGIDSSIVSLLVAENITGTPRSYSIGFDEEEFDETSDQHLVSSFLGTRHKALNITADDIANAFPEALWHAEVPVFRSAFVPMYLLSKMVGGDGIKVVMTGEGADEAFLGYDIFKETLLRSSWSGWDNDERRSRLGRLYPYLKRFSEYDQTALVALFNRFSANASDRFFSHQVRFHNSTLVSRLLKSSAGDLDALSAHISAPHEGFAALSTMRKAQWLEYKTLLTGYLLSTQGDRMSLAHSVENRCPFLDPAVVRAACATNLLFDDGLNEKYLLKKAFAGRLPERVLTKPKQPYRAPDASVFLRTQPDYLEAVRSERELSKLEGLNSTFAASFVAKLFTKPVHQISQAENQAFLFLLSVSLLNRMFVERRGREAASIEHLIVRRADRRVCA